MDKFRAQKRSSISFGSYQRQHVGDGNSHLIGRDMFPNLNKNINYSDSNGGSNSNLNSPDGGYSNVTRSPMYSPLNLPQSNTNSNGSAGTDFAQNTTFNQLNQYRNFGGNGSSDLAPAAAIDNTHTNNNGYTGYNDGIGHMNNNVVCEYESTKPLFGLDWSIDDYVALGSYKEDSLNKLQVIHSNDLLTWEKVAECNVTYPVGKIQWLPSVPNPRKVATSSECLRIWSLDDNVLDNPNTINNNINGNNRQNTNKKSLTEQINLSLCKYNEQHQIINNSTNSVSTKANTKLLGQLPPVTSFHWNSIDTNMIISSSIDTTCIVWDLQSSNYVKTQLIAHDSEVFDVRFLAQTTQLFASCGGDGSVRVFDLRALQHSTIIYETVNNLHSGATGNDQTAKIENLGIDSLSHALLRLEPSPTDPNLIATFGLDKKSILILDLRNPGVPILILKGHSSSVNQINWHPTKPYVLLSCGDDCQVLYWDLNDSLNPASYSKQLNNNGSSNGNIPDNTNANSKHAIVDQNMESANSKWKTQNKVKMLDLPTMCYSNGKQEVNNIVWRPHSGDWFGCVTGKKFQNVRSTF